MVNRRHRHRTRKGRRVVRDGTTGRRPIVQLVFPKPFPEPRSGNPMRDAYHEEIDSISDSLVEMTRLVGSAMARATTALLDADLSLAESVIAADDTVDELQHTLDDRSLDLLARQQPVAGDLRTIITSLRMSADLERMGDLA